MFGRNDGGLAGVGVCAVALACHPACVDFGEEGLAQTTPPLVGGLVTTDYPAALFLENPDGRFCTGTLIAPTVVLTAAHCQIQVGGTASVRSSGENVSSHAIIDVVSHRYHDGGSAFSDHDLALVRLADAPAVEPRAFRTEPLGDVRGQTLRVVGFGVINGTTLEGAGWKRRADFQIEVEIDDYFRGNAVGASICYGDSGGPAFLDIDGVETIVGVTRSQYNDCSGASEWTRVETYAHDFIIPFLDAWYGPCAFDGTCRASDCRTPDPDCAPCGIDGECSAGCPTVDLDCPLGTTFGFECTSNDDCESRLCIPRADGSGSYCSQLCDEPDDSCPQMAECVPDEDGMRCEYPAPADDPEGGGCSSSPSGAPLGTALAIALWIAAQVRRCRHPRAFRRG